MAAARDPHVARPFYGEQPSDLDDDSTRFAPAAGMPQRAAPAPRASSAGLAWITWAATSLREAFSRLVWGYNTWT